MKKISSIVKKSLMSCMVVVQIFGYSAVPFSRIALADDTTASTSEAAVSSACPPATGTTSPTGAGYHTFVFNTETCLWENAYYTWNPVTKQYTPKYSQAPVYNAETNTWDYTVWEYIAAAGQYKSRVISTPATVSEQIAQGDSPAASSVAADPSTGVTAQQSGSSTISNGNGTDSNNSVVNNNSAVINADLSNYAAVITTLDSNATSGNASVLQNTTVGDVSTGDASAVANILNMIQSSWDPTNGNVNLFNANLYNNYVGDLLFDPSIALGNGTSSLNTITDNGSVDLTLNVEENASIENNINLNAMSGDATANGNTTVGDVSTGDATAVANVINMINSMITSGDSFIGSINLYGDLVGDILLPTNLMEILLGNGTNSTNTSTSNQDTSLDVDVATNSSITNNTDLTATSGGATANNNTTVGDISTGDATTNVNEMNLVGQNVQGTKGLLVFVNVLGSWVGMLFGSPTNAGIAAGNGTNSTNTITNNTSTDTDVNVNRDYEITNNINVNATTGNATANANTDVGNVSSGDATAGVNLLNMIDSNLNFSDWFGVLFINVFGSWQGSFGQNTAFGDKPAAPGMGGGSQATTTSASATTTSGGGSGPANTLRNFGLAAHSTATNNGEEQTTATTENTSTSAVAGASTSSGTNTPTNGITRPAAVVNSSVSPWFAISAVTVAFSLLGVERYLTLRRR